MALPPLQLEEYFFDRVVVNARRDFDTSTDQEGEFQTSARFSQNPDDDRLWRADVRVQVVPAPDMPAPKYEIDILAIGIFRVHPGFPTENVPKLIGVTGVSMLYTSIRDFLMTITGRGPWGPVMLPTTSFADVEPKPADPYEEQSDALLAALRDLGPIDINELAKALDAPPEEVRPVVQELRKSDRIQATGKGRGMKYSIPDHS